MPKPKGVLHKWTRAKRCKHSHLSGRRCAQSAVTNRKFCGLHTDKCAECGTMLAAFVPAKGWPKDVLGD